ncbi:MAG: hypothetical protein AB7E29_06630 [Xanthobacter sp.]
MAAAGLLACVSGGLQLSAALAQQADASGATDSLIHLTLTTSAVDTDPGGTFVSVSVKNETDKTLNQINVRCLFLDGDSAAGSASTPIYATPPGETGYGQVRLIGADATSASCRITSAQ